MWINKWLEMALPLQTNNIFQHTSLFSALEASADAMDDGTIYGWYGMVRQGMGILKELGQIKG